MLDPAGWRQMPNGNELQISDRPTHPSRSRVVTAPDVSPAVVIGRRSRPLPRDPRVRKASDRPEPPTVGPWARPLPIIVLRPQQTTPGLPLRRPAPARYHHGAEDVGVPCGQLLSRRFEPFHPCLEANAMVADQYTRTTVELSRAALAQGLPRALGRKPSRVCRAGADGRTPYRPRGAASRSELL